MAEERATELKNEAYSINKEVQENNIYLKVDPEDKKGRHARAKMLSKMEEVNINAAMADVKARKLKKMVEELKASTKAAAAATTL
eukprot:gnl/TRDRNA2_/TRDRNA2_134328_c0_seq3.p1 gnl/TRDRNA2_/TRDRNA2_134328_c0~~gnl/TRDRNA2_/TRDRNA2_134328_c0_seq3.p1  ORF type:complete len:100 (+),score=39.04 gnl/TRDRNA2_/TRDRNA2_134328_c0_seq3:48-302(+)